MKNFLVASFVFLVIVALGGSFALAKDVNNLNQYDDQLVADVIEIENNFLYPVVKLFWPTLVKPSQNGEVVTSDVRLASNLTLVYSLYTLVETLYTGVVNDSSCGDESTVKQSSWQVKFGGLPGYAYFVISSNKVKIERTALQADGTGKNKNIACERDVVELAGVTPGQEEHVKSVLSSYFPNFVWGNLVWSPDDKVAFAVEVTILPAQYLRPNN